MKSRLIRRKKKYNYERQTRRLRKQNINAFDVLYGAHEKNRMSNSITRIFRIIFPFRTVFEMKKLKRNRTPALRISNEDGLNPTNEHR